MIKKPIIAIDISTKGLGGGPYTSSMRIMESKLKNNYEFKVLLYNIGLGSGISIKRILDLKKQLQNGKPDIVHFTGLQLSGFHIAVACKLAGVKNTVLTIRGTSADALYFHPLKKMALKYILEPLTLLLVKRYYGVSDYVMSRQIAKIFKYKSFGTIYNFPPFLSKTSWNRNIFRKEIKAEADSDLVLVVSVARIIKDKGYHVLDEVILNLELYKMLKFIIVGEGDYLDHMKNKLQKQVKNGQVFFLGYREDIQQILQSCDIFVLPTLHETLSVALLEASVEKLALVASDTGGVPEILESGYNGFLVEPGNVKALQDAIIKLYLNKDLRQEMAENARKKIESKFSEESIVEKINQVYQSLLKK